MQNCLHDIKYSEESEQRNVKVLIAISANTISLPNYMLLRKNVSRTKIVNHMLTFAKNLITLQEFFITA